MNGSFCNLGKLAFWLALVLTSPKKGETAIRCCDPALSVLVMLVSRNVFHVLSALQSIVCLYTFFLADQISCRSYVARWECLLYVVPCSFWFHLGMSLGSNQKPALR